MEYRGRPFRRRGRRDAPSFRRAHSRQSSVQRGSDPRRRWNRPTHPQSDSSETPGPHRCRASTNGSLLAVKSVLQLSSTSDGGGCAAGRRLDLRRRRVLEELFTPFLRKISTAFSISPPASVRTFLHSIIPCPVRARRFIDGFCGDFGRISFLQIPSRILLSKKCGRVYERQPAICLQIEGRKEGSIRRLRPVPGVGHSPPEHLHRALESPHPNRAGRLLPGTGCGCCGGGAARLRRSWFRAESSCRR